MRSRPRSSWWALALILAALGLHADAATTAGSGLFGKVKPTYTRVLQCREGCLEKFAIKESICQQRPECSMCWDECAKPPPPKINKSILETWALRTVSMLQQGALVLVDVAWAPLNMPNQCLVTWEVSGGGLMGNLLTESSSVQLSLWPDTKYRVQVTCKNKKTGAMSRSLPLTIDTMEANPIATKETEVSSSTTPSVQTIGTTTTPQDPTTIISDDELKYKEFHEFYDHLAAKWNPSNSGDVTVSKVVPASQSDYSTLPIATLSELQQPLLACAIGGVIVLAVVLSFYVWLWTAHSTPSDKKHLFEEDNSSVICPSIGETNHFGSGVATDSDTAALDPTNYSRTVHVLTV
ncbi:unnamed protein product [Hermetia illucens]|uniref:Fibronectin type-III domain-containing protein n=1 Tax=Hermetia illucens TaxID=343691 RepID=A0A7R8V2N9_HERIL|nr:uncharacterized protein LOC119657104 isoform X2 [Hermetia illucens]CAD7091528.1 unnamed protein product [Hermetia illucens]